jgi:hypothetical protein
MNQHPLNEVPPKYPRDPLVNDEIMLIREICAVGDGGGRGKIPINEGSLNIPAPMFMKY